MTTTYISSHAKYKNQYGVFSMEVSRLLQFLFSQRLKLPLIHFTVCICNQRRHKVIVVTPTK